MHEIEVKAKIGEIGETIDRLKALGCHLSDPVLQHDTIYAKQGDPNILRIRRSGEKKLFTLKQNIANELDCIERELEIGDIGQLTDILGFLGFRQEVEVKKSRKKCRYRDYEICLDEVDGLGSFIEVEKMSDEDGIKIQEELLVFLESIGVSREMRVMNGYDTLILMERGIKAPWVK